MPVDPPIQNLLDLLNQPGRPAMSSGTPIEGRAMMTAMTGLLNAAFPDGPRVPVGEVTDVPIAGVPCRVYRPAGATSATGATGPVPTTVMFHGGGFVIGDLASHDDQARMLVVGTGGVVISVDYRLAPEAPWPAAVDDCEAVTRAVIADIASYGGDPARIGVAGDSAGGNLSAIVAQRLHASPATHPLKAQLLWYPAVDMVDTEDFPSRTENAEGYFLTAEDMLWFAGHYLGGADRTDPAISPLRADDLSGLPAAVVGTAEYDPLRDEGNAYAVAMEKAGVEVRAAEHAGMIHGYAGMVVISPAAQAATDEDIAAYRALLNS